MVNHPNRSKNKRVTPPEFAAYVASRGYRAEPIFNSTTAGEGELLRVTGYELIGPRGNRKVVGMDANGTLPLFDAELWCDVVDYGTAKLRR